MVKNSCNKDGVRICEKREEYNRKRIIATKLTEDQKITHRDRTQLQTRIVSAMSSSISKTIQGEDCPATEQRVSISRQVRRLSF